MATTVRKGAVYDYRTAIKDQFVQGALDTLANRIQNVIESGNFAQNGNPSPPSAPNSLAVTAQNGLVTATINHPHAPAGTQWVLYYSTSPTFQSGSTIEVQIARPFFQQYLPQQTLYFKATAKFQASSETSPVYLESSPGKLQAVATGMTPNS